MKMGRKPKKESDRRSETVLVRLTKEMKKQFAKRCEEEFIDMSVRIRQLISKDLHNK